MQIVPEKSNDGELFLQIVDILQRLKFKPGSPRSERWRTADQLAIELGVSNPREMDRIEHILREHEQRSLERLQAGEEPHALVRRAKYPDRTTALPLWGSVEHHGQPWQGCGPERTDEPEAIDASLVVPDRSPHVFLSHTRHDSELSRRLSEALALRNIGAWRFETHISLRGNIADCVRAAIGESVCILGLVTRSSVSSLWVLTELHTAMQQKKPALLVVDSEDELLLRLLQSAKYNHPDGMFDSTVQFDEEVMKALEFDNATRESATRAERYSGQVKDFLATLPYYLGRTDAVGRRQWQPILAFPSVRGEWPGLVQICDFGEVSKYLGNPAPGRNS